MDQDAWLTGKSLYLAEEYFRCTYPNIRLRAIRVHESTAINYAMNVYHARPMAGRGKPMSLTDDGVVTFSDGFIAQPPAPLKIIRSEA